MVNELLTQIDCFKGILVVTTNFIEHLDAAAMRRFDLKVGFDYLKADQAIKLWDKCSEDFSLVNENFDVSKLAELKMLTPGDFSNIVRQSKFLPIRDSIDLYSRLKKEISHKNNSKNIQKIGFLANVHG
jgi:ATP-dependent 26S proteasome regulatory subunit